MKVVVIGGGSSYTPELVEGLIIYRDSLPVTELWLVDIDRGAKKLAINEGLVNRMFKKANLSTKVVATTDRKAALKDASYVLTQLRVGGLEARGKDEAIPLKYGLVGQETTGAGGFAKAMRTIPVMKAICEDIENLCPGAWLINFTNPAGIITEFVNTRTNVKCIGLCNVPINMVYEVAEKLEVDHREVDARFFGLNHLSFMGHLYQDGVDRLAEVIRKERSEAIVANIQKEDGMDEMMIRLGMPMSPYMQYFYFEDSMVAKEQQAMESEEGTRAQVVAKVEAELFELYAKPDLDEKPEALARRGGARYSEAAIALMNSIHNNIGDVQVVNVINGHTLPELPENVAIETNCVIDAKGAHPLEYGPMPLTVRGLVSQVKAYEQLTIEAAVTSNQETAIMALLNNPLVHTMDQAKALLLDLIEGHRPYLDYLED